MTSNPMSRFVTSVGIRTEDRPDGSMTYLIAVHVEQSLEAAKAVRDHISALVTTPIETQHVASNQELPRIPPKHLKNGCYSRADALEAHLAAAKAENERLRAALEGLPVETTELHRLRTEMLEVNKALGLDRDNQDNALRVKTALRLRLPVEPSACPKCDDV